MPVRKYVVRLSRAERESLEALIGSEAPRSRRVKHAKILLECDMGRSAAKIAYKVGVGHSTVERTRQRYAEGGLAAALKDKPRPGGVPKLKHFTGGENAPSRGRRVCENLHHGRKRDRI